jgi:hypothetical protein
MSIEVAGTLDGIVTAVLVVIIDFKKLHTTDKMTESNKRISNKVMITLIEKTKKKEVENKIMTLLYR